MAEEEQFQFDSAHICAYIDKLIAVAIAANNTTKTAKEDNRYYFRVTAKSFNTLKRTLEALRKPP